MSRPAPARPTALPTDRPRSAQAARAIDTRVPAAFDRADLPLSLDDLTRAFVPRIERLCFQVPDDVLGIWGREPDTGKSSGGDIRRRKKSLPIVLALGIATGAAHERLVTLYSLPAELDAPQERDVREILHDCEAEALCQQQAELHAARAVRALAAAEPATSNPFLATLRSLTGSLTARTS
jgi:hypothetical protein